MTRRTILAFIATAALLLVAPHADAAARYRNCASLNADHPNGVGRSGAVDKTKGVKVTTFTVNATLYKSVAASLDRDKDGIACEKA